jgi:O-antigen/teichoic acid export membrane protein
MPGDRSTKAIVFTFANGITFLISFLMLPYLSRSLTYEDYGSYTQLFIIGTILTLLLGLGITLILNVLFVENTGAERKVFSTMFNLHVCVGLIGIVLTVLIANHVARLLSNNKLSLLLIYFAPYVAFQLVGSYLNTALVYFNKVKSVSVIAISSNVLQTLLLLIAIQVYHSLVLAVIAIIVAGFIFIPIRFLCIPGEYRTARFFDKKIINHALKLSWALYVSSFLTNGIIYMSSFMVSAMLTTKNYAIYRNGSIEIPFISSIYASITTTLLPDLTRMFAENKTEEVFMLKRKISSVSAGVVFPITIYAIIMSPYFIPLYLSNKYQGSALVFAIYNIITLFRINDYFDLLIIAKRNKSILYANAIAFIIAILLTFILTKMFGGRGSAAAVVISVMVMVAIMLPQTLRATNMQLRNYFDLPLLIKIAVICSVFSIGCSLFCHHFPSAILLLVVTGFYFVVVYLCLFRLKLVNPDILFRQFAKLTHPA